MALVIKYTLVAIFCAGTVVVVSLVWPKFTTKPEPAALQDVRSVVLGTEVGQSAADILGIGSDGGSPLNLSDTVSSVAGVITSSVEQKVQQVVSDQVASQVIKQYEQLPAVQQERVVEMICKPKE